LQLLVVTSVLAACLNCSFLHFWRFAAAHTKTASLAAPGWLSTSPAAERGRRYSEQVEDTIESPVTLRLGAELALALAEAG
jgi:hypothetical protein